MHWNKNGKREGEGHVGIGTEAAAVFDLSGSGNFKSLAAISFTHFTET